MKKILVIVLSIAAHCGYAQNRQTHQQVVAVRDFMRPYRFYADKPDSAVKLAILSATDNLLNAPYGAVQIRYVEISADGKVLAGSRGMYNCTGPCYQVWNNSADNNTAFRIITDSVIHHPVVAINN